MAGVYIGAGIEKQSRHVEGADRRGQMKRRLTTMFGSHIAAGFDQHNSDVCLSAHGGQVESSRARAAGGVYVDAIGEQLTD
jgi:hypothetical protein